jgi:predicted nucleic acid-binding protein
LSLFQTAPVDQAIIDIAGGLYRKWHPSHGIDIHDAILASTAMHSSGKIFTLNKKHYPMPDILVEKAW